MANDRRPRIVPAGTQSVNRAIVRDDLALSHFAGDSWSDMDHAGTRVAALGRMCEAYVSDESEIADQVDDAMLAKALVEVADRLPVEVTESFDDIRTFADADSWIAFTKADQVFHPKSALATMLADALRARDAIDPQTYAAMVGNPDYVNDPDLLGDLKLTDTERAAVGEVA